MITSKYKKIIVLVLDSVGCGSQPDYRKFNKKISNTLANLYNYQGNFRLPNLEKLGLRKILFDREDSRFYVAGKMQEQSYGNDTFVGISEMFGYILKKRFRSSTKGFSKKLIKKIETTIGCSTVGNEYISGFKALDKYFNQHVKLNAPILYLADDGVVLFAAHENVIAPDVLNKYGHQLADLLASENISRVITRPFVGKPNHFMRTDKRKDFLSYNDYQKGIVTNLIVNSKLRFITTEHLYNLMGQPAKVKFLPGNYNNKELLPLVEEMITKTKVPSVMFFCFQDFDIFGHKKDINGYRDSLREFDYFLPKVMKSLGKEDLLIVTADHGCDPTVDLRGHTREFVPLIIYSKLLAEKKIFLGDRETFSDLAQTICYNYNLPVVNNGKTIYEIF